MNQLSNKDEGRPRPVSDSKRVLVVDDGPNAAEILAMFFQLEGLETNVATDGLSAIEIAKQFDPHLICMDLGMPRMDGFEAARRIRSMKPGIVIVALSGSNGAEDFRKSADAGFDLHLVKPVTPNDLRALIERYFAK